MKKVLHFGLCIQLLALFALPAWAQFDEDGTSASSHGINSTVRPTLDVHHHTSATAFVETETKVGDAASTPAPDKFPNGSAPGAGTGRNLTGADLALAVDDTVVQCAGADDSAALANAVTTAAGGFIVIRKGQTCAGSDINIPALRIEKGGLLKPVTGHTISLSGPFDVGAYQTFTNATSGLGKVSFSGNSSVSTFFPQWWGAVADGSTDSILAFTAAIAAMPDGTILALPWSSNHYKISSTLTINKAITVKGLGGVDFGAYPTNAYATDMPAQAKSIVIEWTGGASEMMKITAVRGCIIENLVFDGMNTSTNVAKLDRMRGSTFRNVALLNSANSALILGSSGSVNDGSYLNEFYNLLLKGPTGLELNYFDGGSTGAYHNTFHHLRVDFTGVAHTFTVDPATDFITAAGHGYANGTLVLVKSTGMLPTASGASLENDLPCFVINRTTNTFQLARTRGGAAMDFTGIGTGTHSVSTPGIAIMSGDNNAWNHTYVWNYGDSAPPFANVGPGVFIGRRPDTYGAFDSYFYHLQAQTVQVAQLNPWAGAIYNLDRANSEQLPTIPPSSKLDYTTSGFVDASGGQVDNRWRIEEVVDFMGGVNIARNIGSDVTGTVQNLNASGFSGFFFNEFDGTHKAFVGHLNASAGDLNLLSSQDARPFLFSVNAHSAFQMDDNATPGETRFLLYDISAGTLKRVSIGAADSCGTGFKCLRVPN